MKKKSRNKHLLKKRRKKLLEALARTEGPGGQSDIPGGETTTPLQALSIGDPFFYEGKQYTVADAEVAGYIAVIDNDGEQDWLPADIAV